MRVGRRPTALIPFHSVGVGRSEAAPRRRYAVRFATPYAPLERRVEWCEWGPLHGPGAALTLFLRHFASAAPSPLRGRAVA